MFSGALSGGDKTKMSSKNDGDSKRFEADNETF